MRRKDRQLDNETTLAVLLEGQYGVLSLCDKDAAYGVPVNYVFRAGSVYIHCAREGRKLDCLRGNPQASFCVVDAASKLIGGYTYFYRSVICSGEVSMLESGEEKREALELLCCKYYGGSPEKHSKFIRENMDQTTVLRLACSRISGKGHVNQGREEEAEA